MTSPPFKIGDRVVCVNDTGTELIRSGVYVIKGTVDHFSDLFVYISDHTHGVYLASRFTLEQPATTHDDYPDSVEDYAHNRPHVVIAYGAGTLLMVLTFFAGLWLGWWLL